jgi:hypothetical protein
MSAWAALPNAKVIDLVLDNLTRQHGEWPTVLDTPERQEARKIAWNKAVLLGRTKERDSAYQAVYNSRNSINNDGVLLAISSAILALVAYDESSELFKQDAYDLAFWGLLGETLPLLIAPAVLALNKSKGD